MAIQDGPGLVLHHPLFLSPTHTLHPFTVVPLFPSISHHPQARAGSNPSHSFNCTLTTPFFPDNCTPITAILATSQQQSLSKDQLFYCQPSTVQSFPSPSRLNCIDLKIPAQSRGWQTSRRKAGNKASCARNTSICCHSSPCQLNSFEPTVVIRLRPSLCYTK